MVEIGHIGKTKLLGNHREWQVFISQQCTGPVAANLVTQVDEANILGSEVPLQGPRGHVQGRGNGLNTGIRLTKMLLQQDQYPRIVQLESGTVLFYQPRPLPILSYAT